MATVLSPSLTGWRRGGRPIDRTRRADLAAGRAATRGDLLAPRLRGVFRDSARPAGTVPTPWVNIWQDEGAAAFVRSVNGGDETVPWWSS
ncbi:hypothetical protein HBB16_04105 [Pseudonocardia sp. MCCB 268]|nr:hypothetical protein [Pseudonocardia cytotoxica]